MSAGGWRLVKGPMLQLETSATREDGVMIHEARLVSGGTSEELRSAGDAANAADSELLLQLLSEVSLHPR
jgi:hypothetical protein